MSDTRPYLDGAGTAWRVVRCAGCGKPCGHSTKDGLRRAMYCSPWCVWEYEVRKTPAQRVSRLTARESTKDGWYWLYQAGRTPAYIARLYRIENDFRVHKALRTRRLDDRMCTRRARSRRVVAVV